MSACPDICARVGWGGGYFFLDLSPFAGEREREKPAPFAGARVCVRARECVRAFRFSRSPEDETGK